MCNVYYRISLPIICFCVWKLKNVIKFNNIIRKRFVFFICNLTLSMNGFPFISNLTFSFFSLVYCFWLLIHLHKIYFWIGWPSRHDQRHAATNRTFWGPNYFLSRGTKTSQSTPTFFWHLAVITSTWLCPNDYVVPLGDPSAVYPLKGRLFR